ncbi:MULTISPECIES: M48 family metalloprotease [Hymenobacter]|uniref:M48 family metalloprotease n=1 Tax=Hymenobacter profundi TaxID=1982110 RepID=A0ABS6WXL8_9BACT|nr:MULTISPECIES: M48 family metalloprotease [Hymenobacter]MBW3128332.1 M48 family metalloprotease [Hymenobacter profundi]QNE39048.1 M48 family metalloprotease [Hymenobacter sp. NBH84]
MSLVSFFARHARLGALGLLLPLAGSTAFRSPQQTKQAKQPDPQVIAQFGLLNNPALQKFIDVKGQQMAAVSNRADYGYNFTIVDSPVINAFAAPDGNVYFTRGIMAHFNNEAQFAGVLGHEIGHITAKHGQKQQTRSTLATGALLLGSIFSSRIAQLAQPLSQGVGLLFLKYGRDDEREADKLGVAYSTKIGYDASNMADFFQTLQREQAASGADAVPDFLSSHPNSADRYTTVKQLAANAKRQTGSRALTVNRNSYLRLIEGLPYGEDPRQGFVEGGVFYHPDLKFRFPIPSGWKSENSPSQFQMAEPNGKAVQILTTAGNGTLEAAAQSLAEQLKLQSPQASRTTINGFPAVAIQGSQVGQDQQTGRQSITASTLSYVIQDGKILYAFIGLCAPNTLDTYGPSFQRTAQGFARLTEASKLNRQSEKIRIKTAKAGQTLAQAFAANGIPSKRYEELAILNGMKTTDKLSAGTLYKVVGK